MSLSLKEQMLKAGLVTEQQARQSEHKEKQRTKKTGIKGRQKEKTVRVEETKLQIEAQRKADKQRSQAENARKEAEEKQRQSAQKRQSTMDAVYKDGQISRWSGNTRYYYLNGKVVDFLLVNEEVAKRLEEGEAAIAVAIYGHPVPVLLNAGAAKQLREIAPEQVLTFHRED